MDVEGFEVLCKLDFVMKQVGKVKILDLKVKIRNYFIDKEFRIMVIKYRFGVICIQI